MDNENNIIEEVVEDIKLIDTVKDKLVAAAKDKIFPMIKDFATNELVPAIIDTLKDVATNDIVPTLSDAVASKFKKN